MADILYEHLDTWTGQGQTSGATWVAQGFTPSISHTIKKVSMPLQRTGGYGTCTLSIRATSGGKPTGGDLASVTFNESDLPASINWYTVTLNTGVDLVAGTTYAIVLRFTSATLYARTWGSSPYAGGVHSISTDSGSSWTSYTADLAFREYASVYAPVVSSTRLTAAWSGMTAVANLTDKGGYDVIKRGFAYNTTGGDPDPSVDDYVEEDGDFDTGEFSAQLTGLSVETHYYVRPYAYSAEEGYGYGTTMDITTNEWGKVKATLNSRFWGYPADISFAAMRGGSYVHQYEPVDTNPDNLTGVDSSMTASPWLFRTFLYFDLADVPDEFTEIKLWFWVYFDSLTHSMVIEEGLQGFETPSLANWIAQNAVTTELGRILQGDVTQGAWCSITLNAAGVAYIRAHLNDYCNFCCMTDDDFDNNYSGVYHIDQLHFYLPHESGFEPYLEFGGTIPEPHTGIWLGTDRDNRFLKEITETVMGFRTERGRDEELAHAASGIAELTCDNYDGWYSPERTDGEYYGYLYLGAYLTIIESYKGVNYYRFSGKIDKIVPHPELDNRFAYLVAIDGMDDLAGSEIETVLRTDTDEQELIGDVLDAADWPAGARDIGSGVDTLQLGWFHEENALPSIQGLEESTRGFFFVSTLGSAIWQNRHYRVTGDRLVSQYTFDETMLEIQYEWSKRDVKNWIRVTGYKYVEPYYGLPDEEWIWYAPTNSEAAPFIPANSTITIWAALQGPRKSSDALSKDTEWNANSEYDKSGTDLSDNITVTPTYYGQAIKFVIENAGSSGAYLVVPDSPPAGAPDNATLLVYGTIYEELVMAVVEENATSRGLHGKRTHSTDARFKSNYNDILAYAQWMLARYKDPLPSPIRIRVNAWYDYPEDEMKIQTLTREIGDRVTVVSTHLGVSQDYFIDKIIVEYVSGEGGWIQLVEYWVSRAEGQAEGLYWILGVEGFSELGETTRLGF